MNAEPSTELRVMVVDDDVDAAAALELLLKMAGVRTAVAYGGEMAVRLLPLFRPALVLMDLRMPGLDGCATLVAAREAGLIGDDTRFFCMAESPDRRELRRCLEAGFARVIAKPMAAAQLGLLVDEARERLGAARADEARGRVGPGPPAAGAPAAARLRGL